MRRMRLVAIACCAWATSAAHADTIKNTFGPGDTFQISSGPAVAGSGWSQGTIRDVAVPFTPSGDFLLDAVIVAFEIDEGENGLKLSVVEDSGGVPGTTVVDSMTVFGVLPAGPGLLAPLSFSGTGFLQSGMTYWLVAEAPTTTSTFKGEWTPTVQPWTESFWSRTDHGAWSEFPNGSTRAYRIEGTPVPEPALALMLLLSAGPIILAGRKRR